MKGIVRRLTTLGLIGATLTGVTTSFSRAALALPRAEIVEKLSTVPVFLIVDEDGRSLTASVDNSSGEDLQAPIVFIDAEAARDFLERAEAENAPFAGEAQVAALPLSSVYQEARQQLRTSTNLVYIPDRDAIEDAEELASVEDFPGVPLFAAVNRENGQYLLYSNQTLPMFFSLADLQRQLQPFFDQNPDAANTIRIEVITLEGLLQSMENNTDAEIDEVLGLIQLVPASDTLRYLQNNGPRR